MFLHENDRLKFGSEKGSEFEMNDLFFLLKFQYLYSRPVLIHSFIDHNELKEHFVWHIDYVAKK